MINKINASDMLDSIENVLWPEFYCENDVYTIKPCNYSSKFWFDKTACESFVNHIHLNDYFYCDSCDKFRSTVFKIVDIWIIKLKHTFPNKHFMIFLTTENSKWNKKSNCILRFCLKREDEAPWSTEKTNGKTFFVWEI